MYDADPPAVLFGLKRGQLRHNRLVKNGGWYNERGEKLGWGDLSPDDFRRIRRELEDDERFIVLGEGDSFWHFVKKVNFVRAVLVVRPEVEAPGIKYVAEKCRYIIQKETSHFVSDDHSDADIVAVKMGVVFHALSRKKAKKLLIGDGRLRAAARRFLNIRG